MAGTTGSSGLNNLLESSQQVQTTLPAWYDSAQQNIINQANLGQAGAPQFQNTVGQNAVNTLSGQNNPFTQGQNALNTIASGAANPWIVDQSTGNVTPNVNTPMGGLFSAQQNQLNQLLPTTVAPTLASGIGSGNFGSLRGQTAVDAAKANALATLQAQQMTAALQNQATGATAGSALGNVGSQGITAGLTTGTAQMNAPFQSAVNYSNLVNSLNVPGTVTQQTQESPLQMIGTLSGVPSAANNLLSSLGISGGLSGLGSNISNYLNGLNFGNSGMSSGMTNGGVTGNIYDNAGNLISGGNSAPAGVTGDVSQISTND